MDFMKYETSGDYATAARFLQLPPGENLVELTKEFRVLYPNFQGSINLVSDDPNGSVEAGLPPGQVRAGVIAVDGKTADVILVRVDDPAAGKIWLISRATLESIPKLYALAGERKTDGSQSNQACPTKRAHNTGDVVYAMALLAALDPGLVVTSLAVDFSAECAQASLVLSCANFLSTQSGIHHLACRSGA